MISQGYPLWTAWTEYEEQAAGVMTEAACKKEAEEARMWRSGRVVAWWNTAGDVTSELVPVVAGPMLGRAFPVIRTPNEEEQIFFYGDTREEAIAALMAYHLRDSDSVWVG